MPKPVEFLIGLIIGIIAKFPKFFIGILILAFLVGAPEVHHMLAEIWDMITTIIFGSPGIPIPHGHVSVTK